MRKAVLEHKRFLRDERVLYESVDQIVQTFEPLGFHVDRAEEVQGPGDFWWEADLTKKTNTQKRIDEEFAAQGAIDPDTAMIVMALALRKQIDQILTEENWKTWTQMMNA
jgi:hypothetical protein